MPKESVRQTLDDLCRVVQEQSEQIVEDLRLKIGMTGEALQLAEDARRGFLRRCAAAMTATQEELATL